MRWLACALAVLLAIAGPAEARHGHRCGPGYIKRLSLGICVSKRSRLARGYVWVSAPRQYVRRHHRITFRERQPEVEAAKKGDRLPIEPLEERIPSEDELLPIDKPAPPEPELPLPNSLLLRKVPVQPFSWFSPERLHP
jgi:hypothetical protein